MPWTGRYRIEGLTGIDLVAGSAIPIIDECLGYQPGASAKVQDSPVMRQTLQLFRSARLYAHQAKAAAENADESGQEPQEEMTEGRRSNVRRSEGGELKSLPSPRIVRSGQAHDGSGPEYGAAPKAVECERGDQQSRPCQQEQ